MSAAEAKSTVEKRVELEALRLMTEFVDRLNHGYSMENIHMLATEALRAERERALEEAEKMLRERRDEIVRIGDEAHRRCLYDAEARQRDEASLISSLLIAIASLKASR
jgi:hypothetical protein